MERIILAIATAATLAATATAQTPDRPRYVAMGSSYAAGAGIGPIVPGSPRRCGRTTNNYPHLLAARQGLTLADVSCGGAKTDDILIAWNELTAQIEAVTPDTRLVTVTIGGNDVYYVRELASARCRKLQRDGQAVRECPSHTPATEADWASLERNLRAIAKAVHARAPQAHLVFVDYLRLVPDQGTCATLPLEPADAARIRQTFDRLASLTRKVAETEAASLLAAGELSKGHEACATVPWAAGFPGQTAPWHPTAAGHQAIAAALAKLINR